MVLHFSQDEFVRRKSQTLAQMEANGLDALLMFAPESMYWLTGFDTFGFCFLQCLVLRKSGEMTLMTRAPDLLQAKHTSDISDIRIWVDRDESGPVIQLRDMLDDIDLLGCKLGVEYGTQGFTAQQGIAFNELMRSFASVEDASDIIPRLRSVKSFAEIEYMREASRLSDLAWNAALQETASGVNEGRILAAMQGAVLENDGDYPANEFVIGSGADALLCRYKSGRRTLDAQDQLTVEFAGAYRHYHAPGIRTLIIGRPTPRHLEFYDACRATLTRMEEAMRPGNTFSDVFVAHANELDSRSLYPNRLNACGYSVGARFAPSWMDWPMFYRDNEAIIEPHMVLFGHIILTDSDTGTAMCLGRTYLTTDGAPEPLSDAPLDLVVKA
ncbi:M24 family metallopeptidase [Coralliovum pocilloporae]|uniref:M24 family metallopeptidase n=1 Tax=Coralliovum pocilloporae TaxID=3066369 RepID=UPI00330738FA